MLLVVTIVTSSNFFKFQTVRSVKEAEKKERYSRSPRFNDRDNDIIKGVQLSREITFNRIESSE